VEEEAVEAVEAVVDQLKVVYSAQEQRLNTHRLIATETIGQKHQNNGTKEILQTNLIKDAADHLAPKV
jgi:hypothetical protein